MSQMKAYYLLLSLFTFSLLGVGETRFVPASSSIAMARSSGGRSRGGSFRRSTPPRPAAPPQRSTTPSYRQPSAPQRNWDRPRSVPVPVPIPMPNRYPSSTNPSEYNRQQNATGRNQPLVLPSNDGIGSALLDDALSDQPEQSAEAFTQKAITPPPNTDRPPTTAQISNPNRTSNGGGLPWFILPAAAVAGGAGLMLYNTNKKSQAGDHIAAATPGSDAEINNDILTVSTVQVALLANCPIQQQLTEIVETMEIVTPEQLKAQLQAVVVALLRLPEYWSHAKVASQTCLNRTTAESSFEQWSMRERSKLSDETLTRDSFGLREKSVTVDEDEDPAAYVVVTLLLGTTHDRPLFDQVYSAENLQSILEQISAITTAELLSFELIWSPQDSADRLTRDELTTEYGDLVMI